MTNSTAISRYTRPSLLVRLRQQADGAAWAEFVAHYGPMILSWCRQRGLQPSDADDVAQMVLLRLARRMRTFQYDPEQGSFRAWLRTMARYAITDFYNEQRERGSGDTQVQASLESVAAREDLLRRLDEAFDQELLIEALQRAQRRVEPKTWQAFERTAVQGQSALEVAADLGMPVASVYKARSRILVILREELAVLDSTQDSRDRVHNLVFAS